MVAAVAVVVVVVPAAVVIHRSVESECPSIFLSFGIQLASCPSWASSHLVVHQPCTRVGQSSLVVAAVHEGSARKSIMRG